MHYARLKIIRTNLNLFLLNDQLFSKSLKKRESFFNERIVFLEQTIFLKSIEIDKK